MTSPVFKAFIAEYKELCIKHGVYIRPTMFDGMEVCPLKEKEDFATLEPRVYDDWTDGSWTNTRRD